MLGLPRLDGPAPAWPRPLDAALDLWADLPARARVALRGALAVIAVLAATGGLVQGPWGPPVAVVVARSDVPAGAMLTTADLEVAARPADLVAPDAVRDLLEVAPGAVVVGVLHRGTVLTRAHLADGPAALATQGTAVVPIAAEVLPPLPVGTRLDLAVGSFDGSATVVTRGAVLVADDGAWRWLRVDRNDVAAIAAGVSDGSLVPAVLPPAWPGDGP